MEKEQQKEYMNRIESLLFITGKPIKLNKISRILGIVDSDTLKLLNELKEDLSKRKGALCLFNQDQEWHMSVSESYVDLIKDLVTEVNMSQSVMETLAVVAWKNPVLQSEVIDIRNNKAYEHLDVLEKQGFIVKKQQGRTYLINLTDKFYQYFELENGHSLKSNLNDIQRSNQATLEEINLDESKENSNSELVDDRINNPND